MFFSYLQPDREQRAFFAWSTQPDSNWNILTPISSELQYHCLPTSMMMRPAAKTPAQSSHQEIRMALAPKGASACHG